MNRIGQPPEFAGWWELIFYTRGRKAQNVEGIIERIHSDGRFEAYRNGVQIAAGRHEDFQSDPTGFTNVQEAGHSLGVAGRELAIYRLVGQVLEVCKAPEHAGRPKRFESVKGTPTIHVAIRRIPQTDPRITSFE